MTWLYIGELLAVGAAIGASGLWRRFPVFTFYCLSAALASAWWYFAPPYGGMPLASILMLPVTFAAAAEAWWELAGRYDPKETVLLAVFSTAFAGAVFILSLNMPLQWNLLGDQAFWSWFRNLTHLLEFVFLSVGLIGMWCWPARRGWFAWRHAWLFAAILGVKVVVAAYPSKDDAAWLVKNVGSQVALCLILVAWLVTIFAQALKFDLRGQRSS